MTDRKKAVEAEAKAIGEAARKVMGQINVRCDRCQVIVLDENVAVGHSQEFYERLCAICFEAHHVEGDRCMGVEAAL